jgi:hypothetical protein
VGVKKKPPRTKQSQLAPPDERALAVTSSDTLPARSGAEREHAQFFSGIVGTEVPQLGLQLFNQVMATLPVSETEEQKQEGALAMVAALRGIAPRDQLEGMLAVQMVGVHQLAMAQLRTASRCDGQETWATATNLAVKLTRTFADLVEALNRHRGKGQQKVTVEHVQVNSGGQAVVGNIEATRGREQG